MKNRFVYIIGFIAVISLILSLFIFLYALEQIYYDKAEQQKLLDEWESLALQLTESQYDGLTLDQLIVSPNEPVEEHRVGAEDQHLVSNDTANTPIVQVMGKMSIPDLEGKWPIMAGVGNKELAKGIGHYPGSAEPGNIGNSIFAGHREMGLLKLDQLEIGAEIIVETLEGKFTYYVSEMKIVDQNDRSIHITGDEATLTLITCYPLTYTGPADERYIVSAQLSQNIP